ncbi:MAG: SagB family peptide dehydrogenase [Acidobacteria bacterium]|nr:SagB family peptide dehydrogenase [Acidobacteriota bacterium]
MAAARIELLLRDGEAPSASLPTGVRDALARIARNGETEDELETSVIAADGRGGLPLLYYALDALARRDALSYRIASDDGTLATATCRTRLDLRTVDPGQPLLLSRFALIRRDGDTMTIETPLSAAHVTLTDPRLLPFLATLATPRRADELTAILPPDEVSALCTLFWSCGLFAGEQENDGSLGYWNFYDLLFHARSRKGRHHGQYGASFPFRLRTQPPPVAKQIASDDVVPLHRPELQGEFTSVIENRHSSRQFGEPPITCRELGELLFRAARIRDVYDVGIGQQLSSRPYPGGGAVYELEIYLTIHNCADLRSGLYHYDPLEHRLARIGDSSKALLQQATQEPYAPPQVLLTITARFARVFWKYESMGYALILKDVGALMQTLYLVAEAMGLGACAIGGGDSDVFAAAAGVDYYEETSVGEFIIGSRAEGDRQ